MRSYIFCTECARGYNRFAASAGKIMTSLICNWCSADRNGDGFLSFSLLMSSRFVFSAPHQSFTRDNPVNQIPDAPAFSFFFRF